MKSNIIFGVLSSCLVIFLLFSVFYYNIPRIVYDYNEISDSYSIEKVYGNKKEIIIKSTYKNKPVTKIEENAFLNNKLTKLVFEKESSVNLISRNAFKNCNGLTSVNLPKSVTKIERFAFSDCTKLKYFSFEDNSNLESIGGSVFQGCSVLNNVILPNGLKTVGSYAFSDCFEITNFNFPSSIESLQNSIFHGCTKLKNISYYNNAIVSEDFLKGTNNVFVEVK